MLRRSTVPDQAVLQSLLPGTTVYSPDLQTNHESGCRETMRAPEISNLMFLCAFGYVLYQWWKSKH
jgi:hypothetical protein